MTIFNLTRAEKIASIRKYVDLINHTGALFLPDEEVYTNTFNEQSATIIGKKICLWLGIKPYNVRFTIGPQASFMIINGQRTITAPNTTDPFLFANSVTRSCLTYYFHRQKQSVDEEYIELASIEFGLGVIFMNTLGTSQNTNLNYLQPKQYIKLFCKYLELNHYDYRTVMEHLVVAAQRKMPEQYRHITPRNEERFVITNRIQLQTRIIKRISVVMVILATISISIFVWLQRPKQLPASLRSQSEDIDTLLRVYDICSRHAKKTKVPRSDDDVFSYRHIDAELSRCKSIKNKHDFLVRQYNQELRDKKLID